MESYRAATGRFISGAHSKLAEGRNHAQEVAGARQPLDLINELEVCDLVCRALLSLLLLLAAAVGRPLGGEASSRGGQ